MSLKWRIALWYATLLVGVLAVVCGVIAWRFQDILYEQAKGDVNATMHNIVQAAQQSNPFMLEEPSGGTLQFLYNGTNLETFGADSYVQVDNKTNYPVAKTSNLGGTTIPPNAAVGPKHDVDYRQLTFGGRPFLVEDRYVAQGEDAVVVHVAEPLDALNQTFVLAREAIVVVLVVAAVAVVILSIVLASQATTPINALAQAMREIGSEGAKG